MKRRVDPEEERFLAEYEPRDFPRPALTVDLVIFTVVDADLKVLLIQRAGHPFKGCWALPGGFVNVGDGHRDQGEDLEFAAHRELAEETGLPHGCCYLEQLHTFGRAGRDPRMRVVTVAWYALVRPSLAAVVVAGDDAAAVKWFSLGSETPNISLAFDHPEILSRGLERLQTQLTRTDLAFELVPESFTVGELQSVYEAILAKEADTRNFRRKFNRMVDDGLIARAPGKRHLGKARPAAVWRFVRG
jgi:8-oxo-dGTP diphosphatase